jgi:20S proteasome subunit beta 1
LVAIRYEGGLIVGADSRTSVGGAFVSHKSATKMVRLTSHACLLRSGSAADTQRLASDCRTYCRNREWRYGVAPTVAQIASFLRQAILAQLDGDNDGGNSDFAVSLLVAGYDPVVHGHGDNSNNSSNNNKQQPRIYSVARSGALSEEDRYAAAGSGSAFVLGLLDDEFHPQRQETLPQSQSCIDKDDADNSTNDSTATTVPLTQQEAVQLCRRAVAGAIRRDGSSGGLIRLAVLDADGMRELDPVHPEFLDATTTCDLVGFAPATRGSA